MIQICFRLGKTVNLLKISLLAKRQYIHPLFYRGTIGNINFYIVKGENFVRTKSSLTAKRVKSAKEFQKTMQNAGLLARASKIGSGVYSALPKYWRQFWMYRAFTGEAMMMLKKGMTDAEALKELMRVYVEKENAKCKGEYSKKDAIKATHTIGQTGLFRYLHNDQSPPRRIVDESASIKCSKLKKLNGNPGVVVPLPTFCVLPDK
jgi:hypothetical protein